LDRPLLKFDHLDVLKTDTGINVPTDNGTCDIHANTDRGVVLRRHAVVASQLVQLDLAKLAHVTDTFAAQGLEIGRDTTLGCQVDHTGKRLVQQRGNGLDGESSGLAGDGVDHGLAAEIDLSGSDDLGHIRRVVGLEDSNLDPLFNKVVELLSQEEREVVRRGVPVEQAGDLIGGHGGY